MLVFNFRYSLIGGPELNKYRSFLSPIQGIQCMDKSIRETELDPVFLLSFGDTNTRSVDTNAGAACFNTFCMNWNEHEGYEDITNGNDGVDTNANVTCYINDEGATLNIFCSENGGECLSIACLYIDILCGESQKSFDGYYDDTTQRCLCNVGNRYYEKHWKQHGLVNNEVNMSVIKAHLITNGVQSLHLIPMVYRDKL
eukprot:TRINITY_DN1568_c0_g1_i1.p1 TRINITY_DN1568_c0_g1~~TRINITY_DN1568_c0_g1_i1.p1  ORF type:complete len:199 (+),score=56.89 TRINITY_DN1568_c0_g1_i1:179-775(+)